MFSVSVCSVIKVRTFNVLLSGNFITLDIIRGGGESDGGGGAGDDGGGGDDE